MTRRCTEITASLSPRGHSGNPNPHCGIYLPIIGKVCDIGLLLSYRPHVYRTSPRVRTYIHRSSIYGCCSTPPAPCRYAVTSHAVKPRLLKMLPQLYDHSWTYGILNLILKDCIIMLLECGACSMAVYV